jgi:anthranilate synthase/aminodeoxychorismate synthase-like glutamine amidotransferase
VILIIDNYDSFTWNLVHGLAEADAALTERDIVVVRNDAVSVADVEAMDGGRAPSHIVTSPGPCTPREAGVSGEIVRAFAGRVPILGVCLGHQCIAEAFGMPVSWHPVVVHGKTSEVWHDGRGLFAGVESPLVAARYHSLVVTEVGEGWEVSAWCEETDLAEPRSVPRRVVMGIRRVWPTAGYAPLEGVQFHPESFMTPAGCAILRNFLAP